MKLDFMKFGTSNLLLFLVPPSGNNNFLSLARIFTTE